VPIERTTIAAAPLRDGDRRALAPRRAELAVAGSVLGRRHGVVDEDDLAAHAGSGAASSSATLSKADLGLESAAGVARCCRARSHQALGKGETISRVLAAHPDRHSNGSTWTLEKPSRQPPHRPVAAAASASVPPALADLGGQAFEHSQASVSSERGVAQRAGWFESARRRRGGKGRARRAGAAFYGAGLIRAVGRRCQSRGRTR
jgi:hypothetical protein